MLRSAARFPWPLLLVQGVMNSAMLGGYLAGQIPAGFLSDLLGGERLVPSEACMAFICVPGFVKLCESKMLSSCRNASWDGFLTSVPTRHCVCLLTRCTC